MRVKYLIPFLVLVLVFSFALACGGTSGESKESGNLKVEDKLDKDRIDGFKKRYDKIITGGLAKNPPVKARGPKKRGRIKQSKVRNLLCRLKEH